MKSPSLSPGSMFADLLRTGDLSGEPYPCAREAAEESGQEKEATCLAGSGQGRLHTSTGHATHVPGPYVMEFLSPTDPLPRPPSPVSIPGQEPAPGTPTADPPSRFTPVPAGRIQPSPASTGFGAEFDSAARNSQSPPPEDPKPAPPPPPVSGMVAKWRAVAVTEPQPSEDPIYGHLLTEVSKIASSTLENEASL